MSLNDTDLQNALDTCAAEPVHIPGYVQPSGCLIGIDVQSGLIRYASDNCSPILGFPPEQILNRLLHEQLGHDVSYALQNAALQPRFQTQSIPLGLFRINDRDVTGYASAAAEQPYHVVEFEPAVAEDHNDTSRFETLNALIESIHDCETQQALFSLTVDLAQKLSGYDRVMIYRFDLDHNGEIVAESKRPKMETFLGLRFPNHDIPPQARALMAKLPIRFISDVSQTPVTLRGADKDLPPLDTSAAYARGASPVHLEYLSNMGVQSTMTVSIVIDGTLWGMISFHHQQPKVPLPGVRHVLTQFGRIFASKLDALRQKEMVAQVKHVETLKDQLLREITNDADRDTFFAKIAPRMCDIIPVDGIAVKVNATIQTYGKTPSNTVLKALSERARTDNLEILKSQDLSQLLHPTEADPKCAGGALAHIISPDCAIYLFREEIAQNIHWAGNPEKTLETASGRIRLAPRGSFESYLEKVARSCPPWTDDDVFFAHRLGGIINATERQDMLQSLTRQQSILIDELNHRVRNILALVRSISHYSRGHHDTLESFAGSLDARIQALAIVHDISRGSTAQSVGLKRLIQQEFAPYRTGKMERAILTGPNPRLKTEAALVVSLVLHELATNAAKYGALSTSQGTVAIAVRQTDEGYSLSWTEKGGPPVNIPNDRGFGSRLIEDAIRHELNGSATLTFDPAGVRADLFLPAAHFDFDTKGETVAPDTRETPQAAPKNKTKPANSQPQPIRDGTVLILEDEFLIAQELSDMLKALGFAQVASFPTVEKVLSYLETATPTLAILDVHLRRDTTSHVAALRLQQTGVPLIFVTGYGDCADLPESLSNVPKLTKPLQPNQLLNALSAIFDETIQAHDTPLPYVHS